MWNLWIDDQFDDPNTPERHPPSNFRAAKSTVEAIELVKIFGPPSFIDFDHDLGLKPDGQIDESPDFLKWLSIEYPNDPPLNWNVHSANPVAEGKIDSYLNSWIRSLDL